MSESPSDHQQPSSPGPTPASGKKAAKELPTSFPRGGSGKPQPLPPGAHIALMVASVLVIGAMIAFMGWLLL